MVHAADRFRRNDGNLTRMEVLLGMGQISGVIQVLVNDIAIPQGADRHEHDGHRMVFAGDVRGRGTARSI